MRIRNLCLASAMVFALGACASSSVLVGTPRPPISPDQVRIYLDPPPEFEKVAILESSSRNSWALTSQQKTNKAIQRLKEEAAELGANGILFQGLGSEYGGSVGTGTAWSSGGSAWGTGFSAPMFHKAGTGIAIYVPANAQQTAAVALPQAAPAAVSPAVPAALPSAGAPSEDCKSCTKIGKGL